MANYNLVVDSTFRPFTYDELSKPLIQATQLHREVEEKYGDLDMQASIWENLANEENDPVTYAQYKRYADDLHNAANSLSKYGLNPQTTATLQKLRGRYGSEIVPIEKAYTRRRELADEQRKQIAANPSQFYERMADQMSLDEFLKNPEADYGRTYSGAMLEQQVAEAAYALSKEARDSEEGKGVLHRLLPYKYDYIKQNGFSHKAVMEAILDSPDADKILTGLVEGAMQSSGMYDWEGDQTENIRRGREYAKRGLYKAIGETRDQIVDDNYSMQRELEELKHQRTMEEIEAKTGGPGSEQPDFPVNTVPLVIGAGKLGKEDSKLRKLSEQMGLLDENGDYRNDMNLEYDVRLPHPEGTMYETNDKSRKASLFNDNGVLKTRDEFIDQYKDRYKGAIGKRYDELVGEMKKYVKPERDGSYNVGSIRDQIQAIQENNINQGGSYEVSAIPLDIGDADDAFVRKILIPSKKGKNTSLKTIKDFDKDLNLTFSPRLNKFDDFYSEDKEKLRGHVRFLFVPSLGNNACVVETQNNGKVVVPRSILGSNADDLYDNIAPQLQEALKEEARLKQLYGANYMYTTHGRRVYNTITNLKQAALAEFASITESQYENVRYKTQGSRADEK